MKAPSTESGAEAGTTDAASSEYDIVGLGTVEWHIIRSVFEYTMMGFAERHRVLVVEPFGSWITLLRMARRQNRRRGWKSSLSKVSENLWVYAPPPIGLPGITRWRWANRINDLILAFLLRRVTRKLGFSRPVLWSRLYNSATVLRHFPARLTIYECGDEDSALARDEKHKALIRELEADTCRTADVVFAVTDELADARRPYNPNTHAVYCAASPEVFGAALLPETPVPDDIARLPRPVLGYLGGVDPWKIDIDLLLRVAQAFPDASIALVGYVWFGFDGSRLKDCPNIHVLGPKDYESFPGYLKGMDVCLMPFPLNDITKNGDALKAYEYLTGGRPVVSTPVPAARRLAEVIRVAETPEAFVEQIAAALAEGCGEQAVARRLAAVGPHSWAERNRQKAAIIDAALAARNRSGRG